MAESLGEKLRQAREEKGISISEVAEQTRISALYLESIENDDYSNLPGGIFNKGFVKSFAKHVGIDEQEALQDYARLSENQEAIQKDSETKAYRPEVLTDDGGGSSMLPTVIFAVLILGLMAWGITALVNYVQNMESTRADNVNASISNNNVKVDENSDANSKTNGTDSNQQTPTTDSIKVQIKTTADEGLAITSTADGKLENVTITPDMERVVEAEESVKIRYYKGLAETVQLTVNGKKIETPLPPPGYRGNGFEYEINMDNIKAILEKGKLVSAKDIEPKEGVSDEKPVDKPKKPIRKRGRKR